MGSFNTIGFISNNSISDGDKCVAFILRKQKSSFYNKKDTYNINTMGNGVYETTLFFKLFSCPIIGYYDDYGSIKNIEHCQDTQKFESLFGNKFTIDEIIKIITNSHNDVITDEFKSCLGFDMDELVIAIDHYDVFYKLTEYYQFKGYENDNINTLWLETLGFNLNKKQNNEGRYNLVYKHPLIDNLEIYSDGNFIESNIQDFNYLYHPYNFVNKINSIYNIDISPSEYIKNCSYFEFYYDNASYIKEYDNKNNINTMCKDIFDKFILEYSINNDSNKFIDAFEIFCKSIEQYKKDTNIADENDFIYNNETTSKINDIKNFLISEYEKNGYVIVSGYDSKDYYNLFSKKNMCDLLLFNHIMAHLNFYWKPSYYGNQDSFTNVRLKYYDICREICLKRIKEQED